MVEAEYCYPGPDDGQKFHVSDPPPKHWKKAKPFNLTDMITGADAVDPSKVEGRYDLFRLDGFNVNGILRYVFEKSVD